MLAPWKTAPRSAWTAAGPVTWTVTPAGGSALRSVRREVTAAEIPALPVAVTGTTPIAALLSSLTTSGPAILPCRRVRRAAIVGSSRVPLVAA